MNNVHLYPFSDASRSDIENMTVCQTVNSSSSTATWKITHQNVVCFLSFQVFPPLLHSCYVQPSWALPSTGQYSWCVEPLSAQQPKFKTDIRMTTYRGKLSDNINGFHIESKFETQLKKCTSKKMYKQIKKDSSSLIFCWSYNKLYQQIFFFKGEVSVASSNPHSKPFVPAHFTSCLPSALFCFPGWLHEASGLISCVYPFYLIPHRTAIPEV